MSAILPLDVSRGHRFYEPLLFLYCLIKAYHRRQGTTVPDLETTEGKSRTDIYRCFVNKLGQICHSSGEQGGTTITAFCVLQPGMIEYRFASNRRTRQELDEVAAYIKDVLTTLGSASDQLLANSSQTLSMSSKILRRILSFTRPRITKYATTLADNIEWCIVNCRQRGTTEASTVSSALQKLQPLADFAVQDPELSNAEFAQRSENLLNAIHKVYSSTVREFVQTIASEEDKWRELRQATGRLHSYLIAVKVLISTRKLWPQLFVDFDIVPVASSVPMEKAPNIRRSVEGILRRFPTNKKEELLRLIGQTPGFKDMELDNAIARRAKPRTFKPIIHCELILLDSYLRDKAAAPIDEPVRFFNEAELGRYIGCGKPTCWLCWMYFVNHPSAGVDVRPSSKNIYYEWRAPDVFAADPPAVKEARDGITESMITDLRKQVTQVFTDRVVFRNPHDSSATASNPLHTTDQNRSTTAITNTFASKLARSSRSVTATVADIDDITSMMGEVDVRDYEDGVEEFSGEWDEWQRIAALPTV